jgi:ABC-type transporter Mla subunit MlaD
VDYLKFQYFEAKLDLITALLTGLTQKGEAMSAEIDRLAASVKANADAEQSAATLLAELSGLIRQSVNDPAKLTALADDLDAQRQALAAAVTANTPAAPTPAPTPAPPPAPAPGPRP